MIVVVVSIIPFGTRTYTAVFEQSAGLKVSEDVQIAGVRVGEVRSVELVGDEVHVDFTVRKDIDLGSRTTADIKVMTLLGTHFLSVDPEGSGELADATVPMAQTTVPFNLQDVIDQATPKLAELDSPKLAEMLSTVADELAPSSDDIGPALQGVGRLSDVIATRSDDIGSLLTAARNISRQLSAGTDDLIGLMKQTNLVVAEVTSRREAIHTLLVETTRLSTNLTAVIDATKADVGPALKALNRALAELRRQDKALRKVLTTMGPAARYVANATGNGPWGSLNVWDPALPPNDLECKLKLTGGC
ncbi:MAG: MCE family protein [Myxococcales bacterium]|nr:MAG: MCE family protein [Myxococcales bacterium]